MRGLTALILAVLLTAAPAGLAATQPDVVILDELAKLYQPVPFDHRGHARMAEM